MRKMLRAGIGYVPITSVSLDRPMPISLTCCPKCGGEGKIWDFADHEEPNYCYCELCKGIPCVMGN